MISISCAADVDVSLLINLPHFPKGNFSLNLNLYSMKKMTCAA